MKLFSTSGIRRKVNNLPPDFIIEIGLAISKVMQSKNNSKIFVARDARRSGKMLEYAITSGLIAGGSDVERKGILPTPALAYHTHIEKAHAGIMLTASHNPPEYNGIKVFDQSSMGLSPNNERKIEQAYAKGALKPVKWSEFGTDKEELGSEHYNNMLLDAASSINTDAIDLVITDPGGGAGCEVVSSIYDEAGFSTITINALFDPYFRARPSEPVGKNLQELSKLVQKHNHTKKVVGLAFDGDADRCVAIDEKGRFVPLDMLISLYAQYLIEQNGGKGTIITHVDASMLFDKLVSEAGGKVKRTKVGDVAIGNMVKAEQALFGGEPCGAWIHPKYHLCPDGPLTGFKILEWISERGPLANLVDETTDYPVKRTKVDCSNELKKKVMKTIEKIVRAEKTYKSLLTIDGLRLNFEDDSWVLIRPSGTEPYIRITSQAMSNKKAKKRLDKYSLFVHQEIKKQQ
ncbi:MAG: phosphoglucosamine mutase [Asgard group archaeon]|nr:phosphoglucosamine mutase [Asgard group archaeon]